MECLRNKQEVRDAGPSARLAVVRCEDPRCENCTACWVFATETYTHSEVVWDLWNAINESFCASVEITTVGDYLAGRTGDVEHFSRPLSDGEEEEKEADND